MSVTFIVNPIAGRSRLEPLINDIRLRLRREGCQVEVQRTGGPGDATTLARSIPGDTRAVLVVGGDGTVREVVEGLVGRRIPVVILPAGTENLVARECSMTRDPAQTADTILFGRRQTFDLGVLNGRRFAIVAGIGFDAEVVARVTEARTGHITYLNYVGPAWQTLRSHRFPPIRVEIGAETVFNGQGLVFVGVMPCYSVGLRVVRDAVWDDGLLDVCILRCATWNGLFMHALRTALRIHVEHKDVIYKRCKALRITSTETVAVEVDGDVSGHLPVDIRVDPGAGMMLLPR